MFVFEDDFPVNGEQDGGGGNGTVAPIEPGLGGFNIILWDTYGGLGDVTGQNSYDEFNQPLSNSLAGTIDPSTGFDACPISPVVTANTVTGGANISTSNPQGSQQGITGMIVTCPKYESDNQTLSPLAGQAVIANLMPEKFSVQAYPGADRIARGEQWVQTNTLDGQHPHDSFIRIGEPSYFQEYGPAGYHVSIGFANPKIINDRTQDVCNGFGTPGAVGPCNNTIQGQVDVQRLSRTPDQRLYPSGTRDALTWTQCWVSLGDPDGEDFMFQFCDAQGNFKFTGVPGGQWRLTIGDQWNDQIIDGLSTPANVGTLAGGKSAGPLCPGTGSSASVCNMGNIGVQQWQSNVYTRTFVDDNHNGIWDPGEIGIPQVYARIYYRDGHNSNTLLTDSDGVANFNETFPLFNWYVVEADTTRYKTTGIHTVYDAGGPADGTCVPSGTNPTRPCGTSTAYLNLANTYEAVPLPSDLSVPGAVYCAAADCASEANAYFQNATAHPSTGVASSSSTGRIDPPWVAQEGWSGLTSQGNWIEFGKAPYASCPPACVVTGTTTTTFGENGGIHGRVAYAATRPFDDATQMIQQPWQPSIPNVTVNLYQEGFAPDGVTPTLTLVDTTQTTSWDDWAQGFYPNSTAGTGTGAGQKPYMSCPGQGTASGTNADVFYFTLFDQPNFLDYYNAIHSATTPTPLPYNSQYKCYDSMHIWNQIQPAPYDGSYYFPSVFGIDSKTGKQTLASAKISAISEGGTTVTVTTATPLGLLVGGQVVIGGVTPAGYNGTWTITSIAGTSLTYTAASGLGPSTSLTTATASSTTTTACTICVGNPTTATKPTNDDYSAYDPFRAGTPMLPPGKYVVEVVPPPGYEIEKEEDKNLLIGDNFIGPATVQFPGLGGDIFIIPDQASVA
ncbi:MAG: hypothetical protein HRJ53_18865, partial [Acidobacteria bacterium Pan2503]|nr:hypothetical protein [Candidatus Acidoferrum panamensis]